MDFRNIVDKASEKIKSVFSRDNSFFYGSANRQDAAAQTSYDMSPDQVHNANAYQQYAQGSQSGQWGYQADYQQPLYQQAQAPQPVYNPSYQQAYQPLGQQSYPPVQGYARPDMEQVNPQGYQQAYQQPHQQLPPQQMQLNQAQAEASGRNRRAVQHMQAQQSQQPEGNLVQFPGAEQTPESKPMDAYVVNITSITGCRQAMTCLRKSQCTLVVMDQLIDKGEVRRYVDMLNGACFALGGTMTRLSLKVGFYILAPSGMMVYTDPLTASANAPQSSRQAQPQSPGQPAPYQQVPQSTERQQPQYGAPLSRQNYQQQPVYAPPAFAQPAYATPPTAAPYAPTQHYPQEQYEDERFAL
jgi:FtsZ-interacting cell division protein YlmF